MVEMLLNCCIWQGDFKSNVLMGCGTYSWPDGSTYEGEVHNGIRHGVGTYKCAKTNTVYTGQWCLGKRKGKVCPHTHIYCLNSFLAQ